MNLNTLAFFTGLFGSIHCVAMCGPLVMALPLMHQKPWAAALQRFLYQAGRVLTYVLFGLLFGALGKSFNLLGWQQGLSIFSGIVLLLVAFSYFTKRQNSKISQLQLKLTVPLSKWMGRWLTKPYGGFFAGMLNGVLPCGMVYLALAGALNTNDILAGGEFMFFFGLGTIPLMLAASAAGFWFRKYLQTHFNKLVPYLTLCMGIWFILRGSALDIPYLSPLIELNVPAVCR